MSTSAIGSVISSYLTRNNNINVNAANYNAGSSSVSGASGHHHRGGGGKFLQDVTQALQNVGLNVPGAISSATSGTSTSVAGVTTSSASATPGNVQQALQTFLYDLHQALSAQQKSTSATISGSANPSVNAVSTQNPYSNFSGNIQNLIGSLNSSGSSSSAGNGRDNQLQTGFNNLVNVLSGSGATSAAVVTSSSASKASLQDFLQQLEANTGKTGSTTNGIGSIFAIKV